MSSKTTSTTTRRRLTAALLLSAAAAGSLGTAGHADAAARAKVTVTIAAEGTDMSGTVLSNRTACKDERKVIVVRQVGARGGGNDVAFASDTTEVVDGKGMWSTGNTGTAGKFYARVKATLECAKDESPTIKIVEIN